MKLISVLFCALILFGCSSDRAGNGGDGNSDNTTPTETNTSPFDNMDQNQNGQAGQVNVPAGPDGKVHHYVCEKGCEGGVGDGAGPCPECGEPMAHNQAFHAAPPADNQTETSTIQPPQEPAQNAQGVWHYTCPNGCAGGAASQQPCTECGAMLAHNPAYHN